MTNWIDCGAEFIKEDIIQFEEAVWSQPRNKRAKAKIIGDRLITAEMLSNEDKDGFVALKIIACEGDEPLKEGTETKRKHKNICRKGVKRLEWSDEGAREAILKK